MVKPQRIDSVKNSDNQWALDLVIETLHFGPNDFSIYRVKNLDELVEQVSDDEFNHDERLPYWAELWPSALVLSQFLMKNPELISDREVLELGCGLGLTSLSASVLKPKSLLCTDYEEAALEMTQKNFELNQMKTPFLQLLDWRSPEIEQRFEVILASDVLYEKRFFNPLLLLFDRLLHADGLIILAEPNRSVARDFFLLLKRHNYSYKTHFLETIQDGHKILVSVYLIRKS